MRTWLKFFVTLSSSCILVLSLSILCRKWLLERIVQSYLKWHQIEVELKVESLSTKHLALSHVILDRKNKIKKVEVDYSLSFKKIIVHSFLFDADSLDVDSLKKMIQKMSPAKDTSTPPVSFEEGLQWCQRAQELPLSVTINQIVLGQKTLHLNLKTRQEKNKLSLHWNDPDFTQGEMFLDCKKTAVSVQAPKVRMDMSEFSVADFKIKKLQFDFKNAFYSWSKDSLIQGALPGRLDFAMTKNKIDYALMWPSVLLLVQSHMDNAHKVELRFRLEKAKVHFSKQISLGFLESTNHIDLDQNPLSIIGNWTFRNLSIEQENSKKIVVGLKSKADYTIGPASYQIIASLNDQTDAIKISHLKMTGDLSKDIHRLALDPVKTIIFLKPTISQLFPDLTESVKNLSGSVSIGGELVYKNQILDGHLETAGKKIDASTEWGEFYGLDFKHSLLSLKNYSSPPNQYIKIKKIQIAQGFEDFSIFYHVQNLKKVKVSEFSISIDKARVLAKQFIINLQQKRLESFSAKIQHLDLQTVLALGLKDTVKASGSLDGHVDVTFVGSKPVLSGVLRDTKKGWIQYRTGKPQASNLSLNDGPMDILNNYLYDFNYDNLSLTLATDKAYDMKMKLSTLGRNLNYLGGKPLLLNVNLEQNLLAAMQSMMLTYDLPSRLKERLEKVDP